MTTINRREFMQAGACAAATIAALNSSALAKTRKAKKGVGKKAGKKKPNILLLYTDQHNGAIMGCAGHPEVITPNMDHLASESVMFNRAYCPDGVCVPSRVALMTGQYPRTTGVLRNSDRPTQVERFQPLAHVLRDNGYRTAAFGKRHLPLRLDIGWDVFCSHLDKEPSQELYRNWVDQRGQLAEFEHDWNAEFGYRLPGNQAAPMGARISRLRPGNTMEAFTAQKTVEFIRSMKKHDKPFFCWSSFYRPHQPYTPLKKYADMYDQNKLKLPASLYEPSEKLPPTLNKLRHNPSKPWCLALAAKDINLYRMFIAYYYALVTEIDHHIGTILDVLEREGLADNTIVIYTSDHGDFVGAHGMIEKCATGHNIYEDTLHIPFIMCWPGHIKKGLATDDLAQTIDLYPTLLDLAGVKKPANYDLQGQSLGPLLTRGQPLNRPFIVSENRVQITAIGKRYKLGVWHKPQENYGDMLFDRQTDPLELNNLAGKPGAAKVEKEMRDWLQQFIKRTPFVPPVGSKNAKHHYFGPDKA
ncbi:MAG: sulfatase family protein [Planctomycetota bacterium]|jgi:arylsulfatase A-like enzyme